LPSRRRSPTRPCSTARGRRAWRDAARAALLFHPPPPPSPPLSPSPPYPPSIYYGARPQLPPAAVPAPTPPGAPKAPGTHFNSHRPQITTKRSSSRRDHSPRLRTGAPSQHRSHPHDTLHTQADATLHTHVAPRDQFRSTVAPRELASTHHASTHSATPLRSPEVLKESLCSHRGDRTPSE
jgi:hypothetical protein